MALRSAGSGNNFRDPLDLGVAGGGDLGHYGVSTLRHQRERRPNSGQTARRLTACIVPSDRAAIDLAHTLGIEVIAEGVAAEQARFLAAAGCELTQGYRFCGSVNAIRAAELLRPPGIVEPKPISSESQTLIGEVGATSGEPPADA